MCVEEGKWEEQAQHWHPRPGAQPAEFGKIWGGTIWLKARTGIFDKYYYYNMLVL